MRQRMGEVAVRVAKAAGYTNAGTVEFLVDQQKQFLLPRDEHAASGGASRDRACHRPRSRAPADSHRLPASGFRSPTGRVISRARHRVPHLCRRSRQQLFPSPGKITLLLSPSGPGIRRDSGMYEGWTVPMDYDPLLAKLIGYGADREQAISRLTRALERIFCGRHQDEYLAVSPHP